MLRHPMILAGLLIGTGLIVVYALPAIGPDARAIFAEQYATIPLRLLVIVGLVRVALRSAFPAERRFWLLLTVAFASWFLADLAFQPMGESPFFLAVLEDLGFLIFYPTAVLALEHRPDRHRLTLRHSRSRVLAALTSVGFVAWCYAYFGLVTLVLRNDVFRSGNASYAFYVSMDLFLFGLLVARARASRGAWRLTYSMLAGAFLVWAAGDLIDVLAATGMLDLPFGTVADFGWYAPYLLVAWATVASERATRSVEHRAAERQEPLDLSPLLIAALPPVMHLGVFASGWLRELEPVRQTMTLGGTLGLFGLAWLSYRAARRARPEPHLIVIDEDFQHAQKMEALGRLAGGVAHDFNNLLLVLQGRTELRAEDLRHVPGGQEFVEATRRITRQGSDLTRQLLAFGDQPLAQTRCLPTAEIVLDAERLLRHTLGEHIELVARTTPDLWNVAVDPGQISQVLINLALNARNAMPDGGRLTLRARNVVLREPAHTGAGAGDGDPSDFVEIEVRDTGQGMDEETRRRIFEPFFTTRRGAGGSGLGLAVAYGIVRQSGGYLTCESEPGSGTSFRVHLPRALAPVGESDDTAIEVARSPGTGTILLAEDEEEVRQLTADYLREAGYEVLEAADGEAALEVARRTDERIDLLLTDVVMPRLGGVELSRRLRSSRPDTPTLFVSGYARDLSGRRLVALGGRFLQKPYRLDELGHAVQQALDRSASPEA